MKISTSVKALLAVSVLGAAGAANAASYNLIGTGTTTALGGAVTLSNLSWTGTGTVDDTGAVFNSASFSYTQNVTSPLDASINANITGSFTLSSAGAIVDTYAACSGSASVCSAIAPLMGVPQAYSASPFNFSDLSSLTWKATTFSSAPGFGTTTTIANFTATPAVPLPAAAWLFGSGLFGLAGTARRRKASV